MKKIGIINGPNLNLLGEREPDIYGYLTLHQINHSLSSKYGNIHFDFYQSNIEGEIINCLQKWTKTTDGIIINPAGYSHTSVAIADCIASVSVPVIEIHISNIHARESERHHTLTGAKCSGIITGFGVVGYEIAVDSMIRILS